MIMIVVYPLILSISKRSRGFGVVVVVVDVVVVDAVFLICLFVCLFILEIYLVTL